MEMFFFKRCLVISISFTFLFIVGHQSALAESQNLPQLHSATNKNQWLLGVGAGRVNRSLGNSTSVDNGTPIPAPYNQDTYTIHNPSHEDMINLFGGYQWYSLNRWLPAYSVLLHYEHQFNSKFKGTVQQYGLPEFSNYNYSMHVASSILHIVGKVNLVEYQSFLPYLSAGIGVAFNRINEYAEQPISPVDPARDDPGYASKTNTNFVYALGAGIDYIYCQNLWFTLGYEYLNLGKVNSGQGRGSWSDTHLNFGTLQTNTVFGAFTYLF